MRLCIHIYSVTEVYSPALNYILTSTNSNKIHTGLTWQTGQGSLLVLRKKWINVWPALFVVRIACVNITCEYIFKLFCTFSFSLSTEWIYLPRSGVWSCQAWVPLKLLWNLWYPLGAIGGLIVSGLDLHSPTKHGCVLCSCSVLWILLMPDNLSWYRSHICINHSLKWNNLSQHGRHNSLYFKQKRIISVAFEFGSPLTLGQFFFFSLCQFWKLFGLYKLLCWI